MSKGDLRVVICNHLLADTAPPGLEVVRISDDRGVSCHIYMEAQIFTPDSKRLIFQRSGNPHGSDINDPTHKFVICDIEDRCRLMTLTEEIGATAISISPDGKYAYYFVIEGFELYGSNPRPKGGRLTLKRVRMDGCERETLMSFDAPELRGRPLNLLIVSSLVRPSPPMENGLPFRTKKTLVGSVDFQPGEWSGLART